jgi:hypothetical protein
MQDITSTLIGVGKSNLGDAKEAGAEAVKKALQQLKGAQPTFAFIFASAGYHQDELMAGITAVLGNVPSSGCSGEGVITPEGADEGSAVVSVMLFSGNKIKFNNYLLENFKDDSALCGKEIALKFNDTCKKEKLSAANNGTLVVLPDSLNGNITVLLRALSANIKDVPLVLGGTAGDLMQSKKTYQYHNGKAYSNAISAVHFWGDYDFDWLITHGCEEIGVEQTVTKADKNNIIKIDNKSAWDTLREFVPRKPTVFKPEDAFHYCLGEVIDFPAPVGTQLLIRTPMTANLETGALQFSVEIPEGTRVHLTRRDPQAIADNVLAEFKKLLDRNKDRKVLAVLHFDCAGRGQVIYGNDLNGMIFTPLQKMLPGVPWIGFLTYGEIAPINKQILYHNFTAIIALLFEKK